MLRLVLAALAARRTQTLAIFVLTALAALGASAAPWFLQRAHAAVAEADVVAAPAASRVVVVGGTARYAAGEQSPLTLLRDRIATLGLTGATVTTGGRMFANVARVGASSGAASSGLYLGARDGVCAQLRITGACPDEPGTVLIGRSTADALGVRVGDPVRVEAFRLREAQELRVSGVYEVADVLSPYWAGTDLLAGPAGVVATEIDEAAFVGERTLLALPIDGVEVDAHVLLPPGAFTGDSASVEAALREATLDLRMENLALTTTAYQLMEQIRRDQQTVVSGVQVAALELVLLSWFALYLAVRQTSDARRGDIGLLKLRGSARWRSWLLTAAQSAIPMVTGVVVGTAAGYLAAVAMAGGPAWPADTAALLPSVVVGSAVGLGALIAAVVAEWRVLRAPVAALMRRVPARRPGWRATLGDGVIALLALAGVYQGYAELGRESGPSTLALLAPGLVGLAVALLLARAIPRLAARAGSAALASGRAGVALSALHVARRPGTHRVFAIVAVAVAVVGTSVLSWHSATGAWTSRASLELGAERVLVVRAPNTAALLAAVRAADPSGRYAMAVARTVGVRPTEQTLAVDAERFNAVATLPASYGVAEPERLAELLHPRGPSLPRVTNGELSADVWLDVDDPEPTTLRIHLESADGAWHGIDVGPLRSGRQTYQAAVDGCGDAGCRLVAVEPVTQRRTASVTVYGLAQGADIAGAPTLGDIARWRTSLGPTGVGPVVRAADGALTMTLATGPLPQGLRHDWRVFVADGVTPLPVLLAGPRPPSERPGDSRLTVMGTEEVAYRLVGSAGLLPRLGAAGALMDLEYAQRSTGRPDQAASLEVWLTADAPADIVPALAAGGIEVLTDTTVDAASDRFARQAPGLVLRFQLFAALILLLLAAGAIAVAATVDRRERAQEFGALRAQGLSERGMRFAGHASALLVVLGAAAAGLGAAVLAQQAVASSVPVFADRWSVLPDLARVGSVGVAIAVIGVLLVLTPAALVASARVVRSVRLEPGEGA